MRVVITGGTGMIGRALARDLAEAGDSVIVLSRAPRAVAGLPASVRIVGWDGQTAAGWAELADGADAIVNLAGESIAGENVVQILFGRWTTEKKRRLIRSRANAGSAVSEAVHSAERKPGVVIQMSGVGYYGVENPAELDESAPAGSDFLARACAAWESATEPVEAAGVRRAILRTAVVLAREGGVLPMMLLPFRFFFGGPLGRGRQPLAWVHLADVVGAIRFAIQNEEARGVLNLAAPTTPTNAEFGRVIGAVMHRPYWFPVNAFALRLLMGEKATVVLDGQRPISQRLGALGYAFRFADARAALEDLLR